MVRSRQGGFAPRREQPRGRRPGRWWRRSAAGAVFAIVWALAAPGGRRGETISWGVAAAHAQPASVKTEARAKLQRGAQLLQEGEFAQALTQFKDAYDLVPSPKIFFNFGIAYAGLARYSEALESFERFTAEAKEASPENLSEARQQIETLSGKVEKVTVTSDRDGAAVSIDGRSYGLTPLAHPIYVDPGSHQLVVQDQDRPLIENFTAFAGKEGSLVMRFNAPEETGAGAAGAGAAHAADLTTGAPPESSGADKEVNSEDRRKLHRRLRLASMIGAGVGVACGVTGFILRNVASEKLDAISSDAVARDYNPSNGNYGTFDGAGVGLIVGGAALVGASAITYLLNRDHAPVEKTVSVALSAGPTGRFGLLLSGSY
jgi:hypothetical protein